MAFVPFVISIAILLTLILISKKIDYSDTLKSIDKKEYPLADIMPIGLFLYDKIGEGEIRRVNEDAYQKMLIIYGNETSAMYRIYVANKFVYSVLFLVLINFIQAANGEFSLIFTFISIGAAVGSFFLADTTITNKVQERAKDIKYEFPEFLSKLVLLVGAGLTLENAWGKIVDKSTSNSPLYKEMRRTYMDIKNGVPRETSLTNLSRRCRINQITKFASVIIQNVNKGSGDMILMLNNLSDECWNERKLLAKEKGEVASTKLLFPMMIILVAIFIIVLIPAFMQMMST
ncbi:type II secretion system F family protein [Clostridium chrysemydis]|uniref:type II secretion system F family protein n=1 Tax=Clostridium chrysemydis TaxID=2665504 RepID=UPI001883382E|nr:type II secretion system F family protein [Clostridium chrysemydis]